MKKFINKKLIFLLVTMLCSTFIFLLLKDYYRHGFYSNTISLEMIEDDRIDYVELDNKGYKLNFVPKYKHFVGFELMLTNIKEQTKGTIVIEVTEKEKIIDKLEEKINNINNMSYYKFFLEKELKQNHTYQLKVYTKNCENNPSLVLLKENNTNQEQINNDLLVGYAYAKSTFTYTEKILITLITIALYILFLTFFTNDNNKKKKLKTITILIFLTVLLAWNFSFNTFDSQNTTFGDFQKDSEILVTNVILARKDGRLINNYGLATYDEYKNILQPYISQYGLQGKVFCKLDKIFNYKLTIEKFNTFCSLLTAVTLLVMVLLINKKYNKIMAICFYTTFLLSPWIVNFARNLYWVEFTWFLPVIFGLLCSIYIENKKIRIASYIGVLISILIKCLCGYEYISVIMMSTISFLLSDLVLNILNKKQKESKIIFKTIIVIGIMALLGFSLAIIIHSNLRGNGNLIEGVKTIILEDVLRRTNSSNLNNFDPVYWPSLNASIWEVICKYFHFSTNVIAGITGNMFPLLCIIPIAIMINDYKNKKIDVSDASLYIIFFLTSISWFILAKAHSYIHCHMNYVLWYFGYVQICFYIIVKKIFNLKVK